MKTGGLSETFETYLAKLLRLVQRCTGIESRWVARFSAPFRNRPRATPPPRLLYNGYRVFPWGKVRPERAADHSPSSSAAVMEQ